ncbi:AraC family transcriptional regulator [Pseudotamlana carrageenivorans]|uniref:AraC family transcriptional regulator n=1 Tax=Pseudotamlana carrageenivorans TaxID=2069432 RepID=A0A2I7SHV5_9FLAO|nr:AraC family transcriptional regulator [Tamlana carrageenivorans]AUS05481.1 AraC family transcriptional regulator [Tamlana carrageenivorans]
MKLVLKKSNETLSKKLNVSRRDIPCFDIAWHYHPEFELIYITKSNGLRFVGDSVSPFYPGDLVLVGAYLPHLWRNDASYYEEGSEEHVETIITKFKKDFLGPEFFQIPEFNEINKMLGESKFGICFGKSVSEKLHDELVNLPSLTPVEQHIQLLSILQKLSRTKDITILSSSDMRQSTTESSERIDNVLRFISDKYATNIGLNDVADVACMTTNSFCRFFKKTTNKSFTQFLNEVRIRNASRLLVQEDTSVSSVCYAVGYNSITNFNKQFKQIMGVTPKAFRDEI